MTNQPLDAVTSDEIAVAFAQTYAPAIGQLTFQRLRLEKQVQSLQAYIAQIEAEFAEQKQERDRLIANAISYEDRIHALQDEVAKFADQENIINSRA